MVNLKLFFFTIHVYIRMCVVFFVHSTAERIRDSVDETRINLQSPVFRRRWSTGHLATVKIDLSDM